MDRSQALTAGLYTTLQQQCNVAGARPSLLHWADLTGVHFSQAAAHKPYLKGVGIGIWALSQAV